MPRSGSVLAVACAAALCACSGGGSVLNVGGSNTPTAVVITTQGTSNIARVLPGGSIPLSALAVQNSNNGTLSNNRFIWSAQLSTGNSYPVNTLGQTKPCASVLITTGGTTMPWVTDMSIGLTIDPTNESNVLFTPPVILLPPAGSSLATNYPYCVVVSATALDSGGHPVPGATGSIVVAVVNPANPLQ